MLTAISAEKKSQGKEQWKQNAVNAVKDIPQPIIFTVLTAAHQELSSRKIKNFNLKKTPKIMGVFFL